jgi:DNA-binding NarL/FixJ family response regulator
VRQVITQNPDSRIAVLDDADLPLAEICSLIRCGIHGYLPYTELNKSLIDAILRLARQELWFTPSVLDHYVRLTSGAMQRTKAEGLRLTFRQEQIMSLLKKGSSNKEISAALNISESTVKFHLAKIFNKMGVRDRRSIMAQHIPVQAEQPLRASA